MFSGCDSTNTRTEGDALSNLLKTNLFICLILFKAKLGGAEGRLRALETHLSQMESSKREVEQKLSSVISTLRRIAGVQLDGSVTLPYRLLSPSRRWSPVRGNC